MKNTPLFFPALTGFRAIAAWLVFVYHFFPFNNSPFPILINRIVWEFHFGVDLFFVLSGFLITYRYYNQEKIDFKQYMVNRFSRIYPMYFLLTISVFFVGYIKTTEWDTFKTYELISSLTMTKALFSDLFLSGIAQGWTLTLEEIFYLTAPFSFLLIKKARKWIYLLPVFVFVIGFLLDKLFNNPLNTLGFLQTKIHVYVFEFFAGIALGYFVLKKPFTFNFNYFTYFGIGIVLLYLSSIGYIKTIFDLKSEVGRSLELIFLSVLGIVPILYGLIHEKTFIQRILGYKYIVLLGKSSYVFYLIHKGFIPIFINDYITNNKLLLFILLNIISVVLFYMIEEPLNNYIRNRYKNKKNLNIS
ncbi:acyltransferase [Faecalibacter sp. LW9]|uniref:acyltransferase family protein n=1 Tax=Faecalibacter sp. LW9 TaxID=3103144 RepID=UPI002AFF1F23|nr:acyltransferase [Faecalibacter sp. LW9]